MEDHITDTIESSIDLSVFGSECWSSFGSYYRRLWDGAGMRIRKNAKVSAAFTTATGTCVPPELQQPHVCELNQSPWDAIAVKNWSNNNQVSYLSLFLSLLAKAKSPKKTVAL